MTDAAKQVAAESATGFDWLKLVDVLANNLPWPIVVVFALYILRKPISEALGRIRSVSGKDINILLSGQDAEPPQLDGAVDGKGPLRGPFVVPETIVEGEAIVPAVTGLAKRLREDLDRAVPGSAEDRENALLFRLSQTLFRENFERAYGDIFGTQLSALIAMESANEVDIQPLYEHHVRVVQSLHGAAALSSAATKDSWKHYLVSFGFAGGDGNLMRITDQGRLFLTYLRESNRPLLKQY